MARLIFLGTGTSAGVPYIGCTCRVCTSSDPRDKRLRTSTHLITDNDVHIQFDVGPDFRLQALANSITRIDGTLITHPHYDHIGGIDDVREINFLTKKPIDFYGNSWTIDEIRERFGYIFRKTQEGGGKPLIELHTIKAGNKFTIRGEEFLPFNVMHGKLIILGYRYRDFAYITDASAIPIDSLRLLAGCRVLVLNALRYKPHPTHFHLEAALNVVKQIQPKTTYLVHFTHDFKHSELEQELPKGVYPAYDNLEIEI